MAVNKAANTIFCCILEGTFDSSDFQDVESLICGMVSKQNKTTTTATTTTTTTHTYTHARTRTTTPLPPPPHTHTHTPIHTYRQVNQQQTN